MGNSSSSSNQNSISTHYKYITSRQAADVIGHDKYDKLYKYIQNLIGDDFIEFNSFSAMLQMKFDRMVI